MGRPKVHQEKRIGLYIKTGKSVVKKFNDRKKKENLTAELLLIALLNKP